jgi:hypothetical protein
VKIKTFGGVEMKRFRVLKSSKWVDIVKEIPADLQGFPVVEVVDSGLSAGEIKTPQKVGDWEFFKGLVDNRGESRPYTYGSACITNWELIAEALSSANWLEVDERNLQQKLSRLESLEKEVSLLRNTLKKVWQINEVGGPGSRKAVRRRIDEVL